MQKKLFQEAKNNKNQTFTQEEYFEDIEEVKEEDTAEEYKFRNVEESERFFNYIIEDTAEERNFSNDFLDEIINYIINVPEYRLKEFL